MRSLMLVAAICGVWAANASAQRPTAARDGRSDRALAAAASQDRAHLQAALSPAAAQESAWHRPDWRDPSPHREGFVAANGQRLHYLDWGGRGATMVFLPGMGHTAHIFDELAPRFVSRFHVIALTLRGHGASSAPSHPYTVDSLAADVHAALAALGARDVVLVGHSLGGHVANRVATLYPNVVARVIYLDAAKDSTGLAALRAAAPTVRPTVDTLTRGNDSRAHWAERRLVFAFWSNAQEADFRAARTAPEIPAMADLYALQDWASVPQPQLDICALDTPAVQFPWVAGAARERMRLAIVRYVADRFVPWEQASCDRFRRESKHGTLVVIPESNHYVFLVSPEQTFVAMSRWLDAMHLKVHDR